LILLQGQIFTIEETENSLNEIYLKENPLIDYTVHL